MVLQVVPAIFIYVQKLFSLRQNIKSSNNHFVLSCVGDDFFFQVKHGLILTIYWLKLIIFTISFMFIINENTSHKHIPLKKASLLS